MCRHIKNFNYFCKICVNADLIFFMVIESAMLLSSSGNLVNFKWNGMIGDTLTCCFVYFKIQIHQVWGIVYSFHGLPEPPDE